MSLFQSINFSKYYYSIRAFYELLELIENNSILKHTGDEKIDKNEEGGEFSFFFPNVLQKSRTERRKQYYFVFLSCRDGDPITAT